MKSYMLPGFLLFLAMTACGPLSLQPLWDVDHQAEQPGLIAKWVTNEDGFKITGNEKNGGYTLTYWNEDGVSRYEARLIQLDEDFFMDLSPLRTSVEDALHGQAYMPLVPMHFFVRMRLKGDKLSVGLLARDSVEKLLETDGTICSYQTVGDEFLLTGSTGDLQRLVRILAGSDVWEETEYARQ